MSQEIPLTGGNVNPTVVRVGDTVRRSTSAISPTVHQLLLHLESKGFTGCPRFLGLDNRQREILSFLEGETGIPSYIWKHEKPLIQTASLLRQYHDATLDFSPSGLAVWSISDPNPARHEVICHNDFAPYNFIYRAQAPYAVIDFDLIGPGPRLRDIAYAAYWLTPLSFNSNDQKGFAQTDLKNKSRRLHLFCNTYGIKLTTDLFDMIFEVLSFMGNKEQVAKTLGIKSASKLEREGHLMHWQNEARTFQYYRRQLEVNL